MTVFRPNLLLLLGLVLLGAGYLPAAQAATVSVPGENFSLDLPDDWEQKPKPGAALFAGDAGETSFLTVKAFPNDSNDGLDPRYIANIKQSMIDQGNRAGGTTRILQDGPATLGGTPGHLIACRTDFPNSKTAYIRQYAFLANRRVYVMVLQTYDAAMAPALDTIAQSVRFTSLPELPNSPDNPAPRTLPVGDGLSLTLPPGWITAPADNMLFYAHDNPLASTLTLTAYPNPGNRITPRQFADSLKDKLASSRLLGATFSTDRTGPNSIDGVPAWLLEGTATMPGDLKHYTYSYLLVANEKSYHLALDTTDPAKIPQLDALAHSLHFDRPPTIPNPALAIPVSDSDYTTGYFTGRILGLILLGGGALFILYRVARRK